MSKSPTSKNYSGRKRFYAIFLLGWMVIGALSFALAIIFAK